MFDFYFFVNAIFKIPRKSAAVEKGSSANDMKMQNMKLQNMIYRLESEKQDLQDALMRTQATLEHVQKPKEKTSPSVDWSLLFARINPQAKNLTCDVTDEFDSSDDGATSSQCSLSDEEQEPEEEDNPTEGN